MNLLAGGYAAPGLLERWDAVEMEELVASAVKLKYERELSQEERRAARRAEKKLAPAQGSLT